MPAAEFTQQQLIDWGETFGRSLTWPACVVFIGDLGTGKTTLVRAIARAQGFMEPVTSPTYGLVHEYRTAKGNIFHCDLYRLETADQLHQLGWDELIRARGLMLVEWPEHAGDSLPEPRQTLRLEHVDGQPELRRLSW